MKYLKIILLCNLFLFNSQFAQNTKRWNGYLQYRFTDNYTNRANFSIKRAKFWVADKFVLNNKIWKYKVQIQFDKKVNYQNLLQDAFLTYTNNNFEITAGQFVPDFSLQRNQPDYLISMNERTNVINSLIPSSETLARDIGFELGFYNKALSVTLGFFNGNGANNISNKKNFLFVNRTILTLFNGKKRSFQIGYSISYRDANNLHFSKIFDNNFSFNGNDFRFGFEGKLRINNIIFQTEYIEAHLGSQRAYGYYFLTDYHINDKNLIAFSVENLKDLNSLSTDKPWLTLGYSYFINGQDIKVTLNHSSQFETKKTNSVSTLQIQFFFNQ